MDITCMLFLPTLASPFFICTGPPFSWLGHQKRRHRHLSARRSLFLAVLTALEAYGWEEKSNAIRKMLAVGSVDSGCSNRVHSRQLQ